MSDVDANIRIDVQTAQAQAQLRALQSQVVALNKAMAATSLAAQGQNGMGLVGAGAGLKGFNNEIVQIRTNTSLLDKSLAGASRSFKESFKTMRQAATGTGAAMDLARERAGALHNQYKQIGTSINGLQTVVKSTPLQNMASNLEISAQRMIIFNRALNQGTTSLLNFGKNLQWAGRQLMVGFTVPLTILGGIAAKTFMDLERQVVNFRRVYGDFDTTIQETEAMTDAIQEQAKEFAKWGITVRDSVELASSAAATGLTGDDLLIVTEQATKLATLGMISQEQALDTMISLNSAFKIQGQELEDTVNFLNAVENQTVLALKDVTEAIPLVAPVIQGLGGDIKDLAVFLTAMREGGIGANEAANALKTSLARLVTPAKAARDRAEELGINLKALVEDNQGDLMGMIMDLARAMESLSSLQKQQLLSDLFGKRQFARMGALFSNIADEASQAQRVIDLTASSTAELAALAEKELGAIEESAGMRFTAAVEQLKVAIAPIGEFFLQVLTPILEFATKVAEAFNDLSDTTKKVIGGLAIGLGVVVPTVIMLTGLFFNFVAMLGKGFATLMRLLPAVRATAGSLEYMSQEQMQANMAAEQLTTNEMQLSGVLNSQATIVANLSSQYDRLAASMGRVPRGTGGFPTGGGTAPVRMATGGKVPGVGNTDKVPALLTPGEFVVKKSQAEQHRGFLTALNSGSVKGFVKGGVVGGPETQKVVARLLEWDIPASQIADAVQRGTTAGMTDQQVAKSLKQDFGPKASYGRYGRGGAPDIQAAHVYPQMQSSAEGVDKAMQELEKGTIKLTKVQETELRNLQQANNILKKQGLPPVGKAALTSNLTYGGEKMMNQAFANTGLSGKETAASLRRTKAFGMDIIKKQMETTGNLSQKQIVGGSKAMQKALEQQASKLSKNTVVVDDANSKMAQSLKKSGKEVVEFGTLWDRAEKQIAPQHKAFVKEQQALNKQYAQLRIMTTKLTKEQEKALRAAGMQAKNIERAGNNRVALTGAAGASTSRRGNVESKSLLAANMGFDKIASKLRKDGAFAIENYALGMKDATPKATAQATQTVKAVHTAARKADGQASPSRVWGGIGKNSVMGYVNALVAGQKDAQVAGAGLPKAAAQGARSIPPQTMASPGMQGMGAAFGAINAKMAQAANQQIAAQEQFTRTVRVANTSMTRVAAAAQKFGQALTRGSAKLSATTGALTGVVFAASMIPGPMQQMAQQIMPLTFGLMAIQQLLPLLMNPWVALIAGVAALSVGLWKIESEAKKAQQSITNLSIASDGSAAAFRELSAELGNLRPTEQWNAVLSGITTQEEQGSLTEGQQFLESESGKKMQERAAELAGKERAEMLSRELTEAMALNIITPEQAKSVASAMALAFNDPALGQVLVRNIADYTKRNSSDVATAVNEMIGAVQKDVDDIEVAVTLGEKDRKEMERLLAIDNLTEGGALLAVEVPDYDENGNVVAVETIERLNAEERKRLEQLQAMEETDPYATLNKNIGPALNAATKLAEVQALINLEYRRGNMDRETFQKNTDEITAQSEKLKAVFSGLSEESFGPTFNKYFEQAALSIGITQEELDKIKDQTNALQKVLEETGVTAAEEAANLLAFAMAAGTIDPASAGQLPSLMENEQYKGFLDQAILEGDATALAELIKGLTQLEMFPEEMKIGILSTFDGDWNNPEDVNKWLQEALVNSSFFVDNPEIQMKVMAKLDMGEISTEYANKLEDFYKQGQKELGVNFDVTNFRELESAYDWYQKVLEAEDIKKLLDVTGNWRGVFKDFGISYKQFAALPDLQKAVIIDYITRYTTIEQGKKTKQSALTSGDSEARRKANASLIQDQRDQKAIIDNVQGMFDDNPADLPIDTEDTGGGGSEAELNWLEQLVVDTQKSKELYGKIVEAEKKKNTLKQGWVNWLRQNSNLSEEAIEELAKDEEAREKYYKMSKKERRKVDKAANNNDLRDLRNDKSAEARANKEEQNVLQREGNSLIAKTITENAALLRLYNDQGKTQKQAAKDRERAKKIAQDIVDIEMSASEQLDWQNKQLQERNNYYLQGLKVAKMEAEYAAQRATEAEIGKSKAQMNAQNATTLAEIDYIRKSEIAAQEELIDQQEDIIDGYEREIEAIEDVIDGYDKQITQKDRQLDQMRRQDELMMRESEMLDHDLKLMGYQEELINEAYSERIAALDKVVSLNQQIAQSQQKQLGLADALSRGDIGAAAQAAQEMQQMQMQFAADQYRNQLETNKENAINSLTGEESGLTREEIEMRQRELEEQSYQNKLKMRVIEDEIYEINQLILGQEILIEAQTALIATNEKNIRDYQDKIAEIEEDRIEPLQKIVDANERELALINWQTTKAGEQYAAQIAYAEEEFELVNAQNALTIQGVKILEGQGQQIVVNTRKMNEFGEAAARAYQAISTGKFTAVGVEDIKEQSAALTVGLQDAYKEATKALSSATSIEIISPEIDMSNVTASYGIPAAAVPSTAVNGIMGNTTNNYNSQNVNINANNVNEDAVAQIVMREWNLLQNRNVK
ncbi:MAG: phage tail tape measure protein [Euryarchaeota archaeon]